MLLSLSMRLVSALLIVAAAASLAGCGVVAFPVRTTSAAVKIVPVAGDVVAYPLDKTSRRYRLITKVEKVLSSA